MRINRFGTSRRRLRKRNAQLLAGREFAERKVEQLTRENDQLRTALAVANVTNARLLGVEPERPGLDARAVRVTNR